MQKVARGAGRGERSGDLPRHEPRLADAGHHHASGAALDQPHGAAERVANALGRLQDRVAFGAKNLPAVRKHVGIRRHGGDRGIGHGGRGL